MPIGMNGDYAFFSTSSFALFIAAMTPQLDDFMMKMFEFLLATIGSGHLGPSLRASNSPRNVKKSIKYLTTVADCANVHTHLKTNEKAVCIIHVGL